MNALLWSVVCWGGLLLAGGRPTAVPYLHGWAPQQSQVLGRGPRALVLSVRTSFLMGPPSSRPRAWTDLGREQESFPAHAQEGAYGAG